MSAEAISARAQQLWAAAINDTAADRRGLAVCVGVTAQMLGRYLGCSSKLDAALARRIAEAAGLRVVDVPKEGFYMTDKPERFDPTKHSHACFAIKMVPLPACYQSRGNGSRLEAFEDLAALKKIPQDDVQPSSFPGKWPDDDLRAVAVALNDELFRRGRHEDAEQLARLVLGIGTQPQEEVI